MGRLSLLKTSLNTRDLGGHPAADGRTTACDRIYRSDYQRFPEKEDIEMLLSKGITTIIDMRLEREAYLMPSAYQFIDGFTYFNIPVKEGSGLPASVEAVPESYLYIAQALNMPEIFRTIAEAKKGVMYNCSAGKDRSGVVTAILLMLCGVSEDEITADYLLTAEYCRERYEKIKRDHPDADMDLIIPQESSIRGFMKLFRDRFGDARGYLESVGLSGETIRRLRGKLLPE